MQKTVESEEDSSEMLASIEQDLTGLQQSERRHAQKSGTLFTKAMAFSLFMSTFVCAVVLSSLFLFINVIAWAFVISYTIVMVRDYFLQHKEITLQ